MPTLKNSRQEKFSILYAKGGNGTDSYRKAYGQLDDNKAAAAASQLLRNPKVAARIAEIQEGAATSTMMDMRERREWMSRMKRLNALTFDPEKDGDLIEELTIEADGTRRYKFASKRQCIMDDAKLAGDLLTKIDHTTDGQPLPAAIPQINITIPDTFLSRRGKEFLPS